MQVDDRGSEPASPCIVCFGEAAARAAIGQGSVLAGDQIATLVLDGDSRKRSLVDDAPDGRSSEFRDRAEFHFRAAATVAARAMRTLYGESGVLENIMLKPLLFRAAREAAALEMALEGPTGSVAKVVGQASCELWSDAEPVLQACALMLGWRWRQVEPLETDLMREQPEASPPKEPLHSKTLKLVDLHGIPDPIGRLKLIALGNHGRLIAIHHGENAGPRSLIASSVAALPDACLMPFDLKGSSDTVPGAMSVSDFAKGFLEKHKERAEDFAGRLEQVLDGPEHVELHVSDHVSPAFMPLLQVALRRPAMLHVYNHGAWPLPEPFRINIDFPGSPPSRRHAWLRGAAKEAADVSPPWRFNPGFRARLRRQLLKQQGRISRLGRKKPVIGVFLTSGQDLIAADTDAALLRTRIAELVKICERNGYSLKIRLRESSDDLDYLKTTIDKAFEDTDSGGATPSRLSIHKIGDISMDRYLAQLDIVLEAGHPTSAVLEALQMRVPAFKLRMGDDHQNEIQPFGANLLEDVSLQDLDDGNASLTGVLSKRHLRKTVRRQSNWLRSRF